MFLYEWCEKHVRGPSQRSNGVLVTTSNTKHSYSESR